MRNTKRNLLESPLVQTATKKEVKPLIKHYLAHGSFPSNFTSDCRIMSLSKKSMKDMLIYEWDYKDKQYLLVHMDSSYLQVLSDVYDSLKSPNNTISKGELEIFKRNFLNG